jgi:hypothetical protein
MLLLLLLIHTLLLLAQQLVAMRVTGFPANFMRFSTGTSITGHKQKVIEQDVQSTLCRLCFLLLSASKVSEKHVGHVTS